jgi:hypothetical protein
MCSGSRFPLSSNGYLPARSAVLFRRVAEELAAVPGVASVSTAMVPIIADDNWGNKR